MNRLNWPTRKTLLPVGFAIAASLFFVVDTWGPLTTAVPPIGAEVRLTCDDFARTTELQQQDGQPAAFLAMLTATCLGATASVEKGADAPELASAWVLLQGLTKFRRTILDMNATRLAELRAHPGRHIQLHLVSETGAYLIARDMGLLESRDAWAAAADEALARR